MLFLVFFSARVLEALWDGIAITFLRCGSMGALPVGEITTIKNKQNGLDCLLICFETSIVALSKPSADGWVGTQGVAAGVWTAQENSCFPSFFLLSLTHQSACEKGKGRRPSNSKLQEQFLLILHKSGREGEKEKETD